MHVQHLICTIIIDHVASTSQHCSRHWHAYVLLIVIVFVFDIHINDIIISPFVIDSIAVTFQDVTALRRPTKHCIS
jgi:hypothetical protein